MLKSKVTGAPDGAHIRPLIAEQLNGQTNGHAKPVALAVVQPRHIAAQAAARATSEELAQGAPLVAAPSGFAVVDLQTANWVVRKIQEARAYAEAVGEWAEAETRRARAEEESLLFQFGSGLQAVLRAELDAQKNRRKSVNLPAGSMGLRAEPQRLKVEDETKALEWARNHCPDAIKTTERLSKTSLNAHFTAKGETPDGCTVQEAAERFFIR